MIAPDVVGVAESAEILHLPEQRVSRRKKDGRMPPVAADLRCSPIWPREAIVRLADGADPHEIEVGPLPLVSTAEAAKLLKVDKSQIGRWRRAGVFPEPCTHVAAGPLWWQEDIEAFTSPSRRRAAAS